VVVVWWWEGIDISLSLFLFIVICFVPVSRMGHRYRGGTSEKRREKARERETLIINRHTRIVDSQYATHGYIYPYMAAHTTTPDTLFVILVTSDDEEGEGEEEEEGVNPDHDPDPHWMDVYASTVACPNCRTVTTWDPMATCSNIACRALSQPRDDYDSIECLMRFCPICLMGFAGTQHTHEGTQCEVLENRILKTMRAHLSKSRDKRIPAPIAMKGICKADPICMVKMNDISAGVRAWREERVLSIGTEMVNWPTLRRQANRDTGALQWTRGDIPGFLPPARHPDRSQLPHSLREEAEALKKAKVSKKAEAHKKAIKKAKVSKIAEAHKKAIKKANDRPKRDAKRSRLYS
jgi:hypothetical protein